MTRSPSVSEVARFRSLVLDRFGLACAANGADFLVEILEQRLAAVGVDAERYLDRLSQEGAAELGELAQRLTVNETFFFRNKSHFRALTELVMPAIIARCRGTRQLNILSAGCASGEEPYSLALVIRDALADLDTWTVNIVGADLSPKMIEKATRGCYSSWSLRATSDSVRNRHFRQNEKEFILDPDVVSMVRFYERNLLTPDPQLWRPSSYHLVFCRNVLMYLTPERAREVVEHIAECLVPGGYLFLGHAETLRGVTQAFQLCHSHETFYYQKGGNDELPKIANRLEHKSLPVVTPAIVVEGAASWIDAIQRSSQRIAQLGAPAASSDTPQAVAVAASRAWDLGLVLEAMRHERYSEAQALLAALPAEAHRDPDALLLRAILLTNSGDLAEAETTCTQLLALDSLNAGAHYVLALCREHATDHAGAAEHDQSAIYLDPSFAMPHLHLGLMARRSGNAVTARRELKQAIALLAKEDGARVLLFGGGFTRESLGALCRAELLSAEGDG